MGSRHYGKVPRGQKFRPRPSQGPAGAVFQFQGCVTLFRDDFHFLFFPHVFRHICQGIPLNLHDSAQKKFWRPFFWKFFTFYLVKWNPLAFTRRAQKLTLPPPQGYLEIPKSQKKFYSLSGGDIFFRTIAKKTREGRNFFFQPAILVFPSASPQKPPRANQTESYFF